MKAEKLPYSIIDKVLTRKNGYYSYYAYKSFANIEDAQKYIDAKLPKWRAQIIPKL